MNTKLIAGLLALLLNLSACTAIPEAPGNTSVTTLSNVERYQATVNAQAALKNVHVHWVNPPDEDDLKKYTPDQASNSEADIE